MVYSDPLIKSFVSDMLRRNRSPRSQDAYARDLNQFARWIGTPIADATKRQIQDYAFYLLTEKNYRVVTARRNLTSLKMFFNFLRREDIREVNPVLDVEFPKPEQRKPKVLRVNEVVSILEANLSGPHAIRDRAMLELLYGSGLRRAEIAGLALDDVDFSQRVIVVTGKGNKRRWVLLTEASISAMQTYLHVRPYAECRAFFLSNRKGKLGLRQVWGVVNKAARLGGVPRASTHAMRHSFATHFIEGGGDLSSLQKFLGHANITTTQIYIDQTVEHLRGQFVAASMRDRPGFLERTK